MRIAGFLLLLAGWLIVIATLFLLHPSASRAAFVLAGMAVQIWGLVLTIRSHSDLESERD